MNTTIRGHNLRVTMVMALLAVLLLLAVVLVFALQSAPTTSDRDANPAVEAPANMDAGGENYGWDIHKRGSSIPQNTDVERHAEVVERLGNGSLR